MGRFGDLFEEEMRIVAPVDVPRRDLRLPHIPFIKEKREEYLEDVDLLRLASGRVEKSYSGIKCCFNQSRAPRS